MRALVLSAGGSKSAFATGAIKHLLGDLEIDYDILCGVSSSAINTAFLGQYKRGTEKQAANDLEKWWLRLDTRQIYKHWSFFGPLAGVLWKHSFYDSKPLQQLLKSNLSLNKMRESGKVLTAGAISLNSGKYITFDQTSDFFVDAVLASAAYPGMLEPIQIEGHYYADGGSKTITPVATAIERGARHIDIIMTSPEIRDYKIIEKLNIINIIKRSFDVSTDKIMSNDIDKLEMYNKLALAGIGNKKYISYNIIRPHNNMIFNSLDFDPVKIREMIDIGYGCAKDQFKLDVIQETNGNY